LPKKQRYYYKNKELIPLFALSFLPNPGSKGCRDYRGYNKHHSTFRVVFLF
jgi:hypothetical protein